MTPAAIAGWALAAVALAALAGCRWRGRRRRRLVAWAVHEIRGPLTAAHLALDALRRDAGTAVAAAGALEAQLLRVRLALDDLHAAPAGRRARDRRSCVPIGELLEQLAGAWRPVAQAGGRSLVVVSCGEGAVLGDPARLGQAIGNLVANALEHGRGPVELRARTAGGRARFEVRDGGPGLPAPPAALARLDSGDRGHGLAIASDIAERHGGRVIAAPSARGAAVVVELPLASDGSVADHTVEGRS